MKKLLWLGDAACPSGYAKCTHQILDTLKDSWDVTVIGINYRGDPHDYPYPIFPAFPGGDAFGYGRLKELLPHIKPDVIVLQNDPWNFPAYLKVIDKKYKTVGAVAVDGKNCRGTLLNPLDHAIFWTNFADHEARLGGYNGTSAVIPLGVDTSVFKPQDKVAARQFLLGDQFDRLKDSFIIGTLGRNQLRKRMDLTLSYFAEWIETHDVPNARLLVYSAPTGDRDGFEIRQLGAYYGILNRMILITPGVWEDSEEKAIAGMMASMDVGMSTTQGEGWGLPAMEMMACGVPQILPDWSAFGEWAKPAAHLVPCTSIAMTPSGINVIGGIADRQQMIAGLHQLYTQPSYLQDLREAGLKLVNEQRFNWSDIGRRYNEELNWVVESGGAVAI